MTHLAKLLEAAFFSADRPLSLSELRAVAPGTDKAELEAALEDLRQQYDDAHAIELVELADGFQLLTRPEFAEAIAAARVVHRPRRLSPAALETLAIIAYRQPVGRSEIEDIRGVAADGVLRSLQERELIDVVGRGEGLGRPLLYGTTARFLEMLGLKELEDLPRLEELSVALRPVVETFRGGAPEGRPLDELLRDVASDGKEPEPEVEEGEGPGRPEIAAEDPGGESTASGPVDADAEEPVTDAAADAEGVADSVTPGSAGADPAIGPEASEETAGELSVAWGRDDDDGEGDRPD